MRPESHAPECMDVPEERGQDEDVQPGRLRDPQDLKLTKSTRSAQDRTPRTLGQLAPKAVKENELPLSGQGKDLICRRNFPNG